jgi:hypothetical protein
VESQDFFIYNSRYKNNSEKLFDALNGTKAKALRLLLRNKFLYKFANSYDKYATGNHKWIGKYWQVEQFGFKEEDYFTSEDP